VMHGVPDELSNMIFVSYPGVKLASQYFSLIGLSYSGTVEAIVEELVPYEKIVKVVAGTAIKDEAALTLWIERNKKVQWHKYPKEAEETARRLWKEGKIEQPRLGNPPRYPMLYEGIFVTDGNEDKIIYDEMVIYEKIGEKEEILIGIGEPIGCTTKERWPDGAGIFLKKCDGKEKKIYVVEVEDGFNIFEAK